MAAMNPYDPQNPLVHIEFRYDDSASVGSASLPSVPRIGEHVRIMEGREIGPICEVVDVRWEISNTRFAIVYLRPANAKED